MEFQALHGLARKLMGVEAIRNEVIKVLNEDETFHELQQDLAGQGQHRINSTSNGGLRRRLPTSRAVPAQAGAHEQMDPFVHVDTLTEPSTAPGSPKSDQGKQDESLQISSDWDDSDFALLPGASSSARGDTTQQTEPEDAGNDGIGARLARWLHSCAQGIARVVGGVCQGAVSLAKGIVKDCSKLMKDVAAWCQQSIDGLRKQIASMPRWAKIAGGVVAVSVLMGAIVMLMMPPPPPPFLASLL